MERAFFFRQRRDVEVGRDLDSAAGVGDAPVSDDGNTVLLAVASAVVDGAALWAPNRFHLLGGRDRPHAHTNAYGIRPSLYI